MNSLLKNKYIEELGQDGLLVNNKILFHGSLGCGKKKDHQSHYKSILILNLRNIVCSRIGETSQNIKQAFDKAGKGEALDEMRRLVNTLIELIDYYPKKHYFYVLPTTPKLLI